MYHFNMLKFDSYMYIVVLFSLSLFLYCLLSFLFFEPTYTSLPTWSTYKLAGKSIALSIIGT